MLWIRAERERRENDYIEFGHVDGFWQHEMFLFLSRVCIVVVVWRSLESGKWGRIYDIYSKRK